MLRTLRMSVTRAADSWSAPIARTMVVVCLGFLGQATAASAASFSVNPTQLLLSGTAKSALLTLKNETDDAVRFQVTLMAWAQDPDGKMVLEPTEDVVFFPGLLTLGAREERRIRVGLVVAPAAVERTYRVFVEELPPLENGKPVVGVAMRTKMGIPVFVQPIAVAAQVQLKDVAAANGRVSFRLVNTGTVHFTPESMRVRGIDASGSTVTEQSPESWYVLAGGRRDFDLAVPAVRCAEIRSFSVEARVMGKTLTQTVAAPDGACAKQN